MDDPQQYTAAQAADPSTPGDVLAAIAGSRPDLRARLAENPATYPALLEWLGSLGDPAVDAALRARREGRSAPVAYVPPAAGQGWEWPAPAGGPAPTTAGGGTAAPGAAHPGPGGGTAGTAAHGAPGAPYGGPGAGAYGPPAAAGDGTAGLPAYGARPSGSRTWLWILLGLLAVLLVGGVVVGVVAFRAIDRAAEELGTAFDTGQAQNYGDDPTLDALWDSCAAGDMAACDDLFRESPRDSAYEDFADTCGRRTDGGTWCVDAGETPTLSEDGRSARARLA